MRKIFLLIVGTIIVVIACAQLETIHDVATRSQLPPALGRTFLNIHAWQWLGLGFVLLICTIAGYLVRFTFKRFTFLRDRFSAQAMSDETRATVSMAAGLLGASALSQVMVQNLALPDRFLADVQTVIGAISLFAGFLFLYGWWDAVCDSIAARAMGHQRAERLLIPITRKLVRALIVIIGLLFGLASFFGSKTITGLVAGLGLGGVVLALAAKDSVENVFASVTILFDMPFALGDWIKMDKVEGSVEEINLRSTRIRTAGDTVITLPNANLIRAPVENYGARRMRRQNLNLRLSFESEPEAMDKFCQSLREFIAKLPNVVDGQTLVEMDDPQEQSIGVVATWFLDTASAVEEAESRHSLLKEALRLKKIHGVIFASPFPVSKET